MKSFNGHIDCRSHQIRSTVQALQYVSQINCPFSRLCRKGSFGEFFIWPDAIPVTQAVGRGTEPNQEKNNALASSLPHHWPHASLDSGLTHTVIVSSPWTRDNDCVGDCVVFMTFLNILSTLLTFLTFSPVFFLHLWPR